MEIQLAATANREEVVALWERAGLTRPWNNAFRDFDLALSNEQQTILIAKAGVALIGAVMVADDGHRGWMYYLGVEPSSKGKGVGTALVAASEEWLLERGQDRVRLMVRRENSEVKDFYSNLGYEDADCDVFGREIKVPDSTPE